MRIKQITNKLNSQIKESLEEQVFYNSLKDFTEQERTEVYKSLNTLI